MNRQDSASEAYKEEVYRLAVAVIEDDISDADARRFERLIAEDPVARGWYVDLVFDACSLRRLNRGQDHCAALPTEADSEQASEPTDPAPVLGFLGNATHKSLGYVSQGWPLAYLIALMVLAVGALIGSLTPVSQPTQIGLKPSLPSRQAVGPKAEFVGRITGMVDCQWAEVGWVKGSAAPPEGGREGEKGSGTKTSQSPIPNPQSLISLGDKLALASGLLEITYDTGAKVLLQGPVTYEVESDSGGYLSVGKLTAKLEKKEERRTKNEELSAVRSSFLIPHSYFAIRTPTATVTDLGTEFGVEVAAEETVETTVFSGKVTLAVSGQYGGSGESQILTAGQTARVIRKGGTASVNVGVARGEHFVRSLHAMRAEILISPDVCNGSFESPALGPDYFDADAGNLSVGVYAKIQDVVPPYWNPTSSLQTKGTFASGVTGEQYVVLQAPSPILSTRFDGAEGHPAVRKYEPHTVYVLTADFGSNIAGMEAVVCFEDGEHKLRRAVAVSEPNVMQPMLPMELDTDRNREFVGKPITISFTKRNEGDQLYIDNVMLKAVQRFTDVAAPETQ
jgi:hypothetical protein